MTHSLDTANNAYSQFQPGADCVVFGASVCGDAHRRRGLECQDSWKSLNLPGLQVVAVSDGHGSSQCPRSAIGSRLAADVFCQAAASLCQTLDNSPVSLRQFLDEPLCNQFFCQCIENDWKRRVLVHYSGGSVIATAVSYPWLECYAAASQADTDFGRLQSWLTGLAGGIACRGWLGRQNHMKRMPLHTSLSRHRPGRSIWSRRSGVCPTVSRGSAKRWSVSSSWQELSPKRSNEYLSLVYKMYGATLLGVAVTNQEYFAFQLGDGDIVHVNAKRGSVMKTGQHLLGVETHSLCGSAAWKRAILKHKSIENFGHRPYLLMLTTDGFANSYADQAEFIRACHGYLPAISEHGCEAVSKHLSDWLSEISRGGCGDDVTAALAYYDEGNNHG